MLVAALVIMAMGILFADKLKKRFGIFAHAALFTAICIFCELVCFNYETLRSLTYDAVDSYSISATAEQTHDGKYIFDSTSDYIEITDLNCFVGNIHISTDNSYHAVRIAATDDANCNRYTAGTCHISCNAEQTEFIPTHFSGNVHTIRISIPDIDTSKKEVITLSDLSLNAVRKIYFSPLRVLVFLSLMTFFYYVIVSKDFWQIRHTPSSRKQNAVTVSIGVLLALIYLIIPFGNSSFINPKWQHHNQYNELAQSFLHGSISLEREVPQELIDMDNPYDRTERSKVLTKAGIAKANQPWDIAYYDGNYYVYFGVLPVLLFYIPCNILGISFPNFLGVVIFSWVLIAGVFLLYREFLKHYKKQVPYLLYILLSVCTIISGGVIYMIKRPDFYSIPIMGALAFSVMGFYFWLRAKGENGVLSQSNLFIGSLFMASVIALRPNLIFFSCGAFVIFWNSVFRDRELLSVSSRISDKKLSGIVNTASFCAPYLFVGASIMIYNAARFSSPFDFGSAYNLTVADMTLRGFAVERWDLGVFEYLFRLPTITSEFPFLTASVPKTEYIGYTSRENMYGGIFITHALLWALCAINKIRKEKPFKFIVFLCVTSFFVCLVDIQAGGIYPRYISDFALFFVLAAAGVLFLLYEKHPSLTCRFVSCALLLTILYDFLLILGSISSDFSAVREYIYSSPLSQLAFIL